MMSQAMLAPLEEHGRVLKIISIADSIYMACLQSSKSPVAMTSWTLSLVISINP